jgi:hypothetical protein
VYSQSADAPSGVLRLRLQFTHSVEIMSIPGNGITRTGTLSRPVLKNPR